jgi:hypothetical protein
MSDSERAVPIPELLHLGIHEEVAMKPVQLFILALAFSSTAGAATLQTMYVPSSAGTHKQKPAPMPAPAETSHYATSSQGQVTHG